MGAGPQPSDSGRVIIGGRRMGPLITVGRHPAQFSDTIGVRLPAGSLQHGHAWLALWSEWGEAIRYRVHPRRTEVVRGSHGTHANRHTECLWRSPHCLGPPELTLFA